MSVAVKLSVFRCLEQSPLWRKTITITAMRKDFIEMESFFIQAEWDPFIFFSANPSCIKGRIYFLLFHGFVLPNLAIPYLSMWQPLEAWLGLINPLLL